MNLSSAKNRIPRAVSTSGIIHFVFDFCSHNNTTIIPWCCEDRSSIQASFDISMATKYCTKCLDIIKYMKVSDL